MDPQSTGNDNKMTLWISLAGIAVVMAGGVWAFVVWHSPHQASVSGSSVAASSSPASASGITSVALSPSAYDVAAARAAQWESDAALMKMNLLDSAGHSWDFTFVSPKAKGKGFEVVVNGGSVSSAEEVSVAGGGALLPANIISPDQALADARAVPGYGNATIVSLEMLYNSAAHQWYWGVTTSNGTTLTIKATNP